MTDFKEVTLSEIHPDPNQPRKFFDDTAMAELTQSVKEKGVLQPILIRPNGKGYVLVCGERRYRASEAAGLLSIPCVIRELTDEEALELQIIENLQRKDVHPMEEAVAFKSLMEGKHWTIQEVASRVGKKDFYVKQRLKLNDLTSEWQQLFYKNSFTLTEALQLCLLPEKAQKEFYKNESSASTIRIDSYRLNQYKGDLHKATFDLSDPTLDKKMGPCTTCQYNTAVSLLFPEHADSPRCMNVSCFKNKSEVFFERELLKAKEDPAILLVSTNGYQFDNAKLVAKLKSEGHEILRGYNDFREIERPEKPDWDEYKDENYYEEEGHNIDEVRQEFEKELADYEKEVASFEKRTASGKYKKAYVVDGRQPGSYLFIELQKKANDKTAKAAVDSGEPSIADIDAEITRIQDREKRAKELDQEKIHKDIVEQLKKDPSFDKVERLNGEVERKLIIFLIYEHLGYSYKSETSKALKISEPSYHSTIDERKKWFESLGKLTDVQLSYLIRKVLIDRYATHLPQQTGGTALRLLADSLKLTGIDQIIFHYDIPAFKREQRVNDRIADLRTKKKALEATAKPEKKNKAKRSA